MDFFDNLLDKLKNFSISKALPTIIIVVVGFVLVYVLMKIYDKAMAKSKADQAIFRFFRGLVRALLIIIVILIAASSLGVDVSALIAILSVLTLAISLAVQGTLSNLAGGIMLLTAKPFKVGDLIESGDHLGTVVGTSLVYTKLLTVDNREISIPNSDLAAARITNYSAMDKRRVDLTFTASYDYAIDDVKAVLAKAAENTPCVIKEEPIFAAVNKYRESDIEYVLRAYVKPSEYWDGYFGITENVKRAYETYGISVTYPHLNLHLPDGNGRR